MSRPIVLPDLFDDLIEMKIRQIRGGLAIAVNNEENQLVTKIEESGAVPRENLDERERELARRLVSRGVLTKSLKDDRVYYRFNDLEDVWRD